MALTFRWFKLRWRLVLLLVVAGVAGFLVACMRSAPPPPFVSLTRPVRIPGSFRDWVDGRIPRSWGWAWQLKDLVLGRRATINLSAEIVSLPEPQDPGWEPLPLEASNFSNPAGLEVWLLNTEQIAKLRSYFRQTDEPSVLSRPRVSTAEGITAVLFSGETILLDGVTNMVGLEFLSHARNRSDGTDLIASFVVSELITNATLPTGNVGPLSVRTNLDAAIRVQVPTGKGVFLMQQKLSDSPRKPIGVLLEPPRPKR